MDAFPDPLTYRYPEWVAIGDYFFSARDIVSFGTPLTVDNVREAYLKGIFPWNIEGLPLPWYCPEMRAVLQFDELKVPRSLAKIERKGLYSFTIDHSFAKVIRQCSLAYRPGQNGTWISAEFIEVYTELYRQGMAHSVEAWNKSGELVGGLYGIDAGGVFCGESMFFKEPNASKLALLFLINHLRARGSSWMDCQVMTPHMKALGAREIARSKFLSLMREEQRKRVTLFSATSGSKTEISEF